MKEYPTIDGLKAVLTGLKNLDFIPTYTQQELIRAEIQTYRIKVLKEIFGIDKDPVPSFAVEVSSETDNDKGIFIFFTDPFEFVEFVDENGNPEKNLEELAFIRLLGLYISRTNPEKIQLSIAPPEILIKLKKDNTPDNPPIIIDEEIKPKENENKKVDYN